MSQIITSLKCNKCGKELNNLYISFGHPEDDFDWKWKCDECEEVNIKHIEAMPHPYVGYDVE